MSIPTSRYVSQLVAKPKGISYRFYLITKRIIDILIAGSLLLFLSPLLLIVAIGIKLNSDGPIIYSQTRIGSKPRWLEGKLIYDLCPFTMYKFRTMYFNVTDDKHRQFIQAFIQNDHSAMKKLQEESGDDSSGYKLSVDPRITSIGKLLRKSSIDELPQFWNILKGDMSLVGPRPALSYEVEMYKDWHYKRLQAKPGLTGLWQVTARSSVDFDHMVKLDIEYIEQRSLLMDIVLILKTPFVVLSGKGAS